MKIADLFNPAPKQWGFRGDPALWEEMRKQFVNVDIPASETILISKIRETFQQITGHSIDETEVLVVEKLKTHGDWSRLEKLSDKQRLEAIFHSPKRQLLVALKEATTGRGFDDIIRANF